MTCILIGNKSGKLHWHDNSNEKSRKLQFEVLESLTNTCFEDSQIMEEPNATQQSYMHLTKICKY